MTELIIDKIQVIVKALENKEYSGILEFVTIKYILKKGDMLYSLHYENRGSCWYEVLILGLTENEIMIKDNNNKILTLNFKSEARNLIFQIKK